MKRLLFYRRGGLGDTLLTFPVLEVFKNQGYKITVIGVKAYYQLAQKVGWVDEIYEDLYPQVLNQPYDLKIFFSKTEGFDPFPSERIWLVDYYFSCLNLPKKFSQILPLKGSTESILKNKVVLHPGSGSSKKIPDFLLFSMIEEFLNEKNIDYIYIVGEADKWIKDFTSNFWEVEDIEVLAKALKTARGFIGLDSGISHLASYLGVKSFIFFGPTDHIVWRPIGPNHTIITLGLKCSPCFPKTCSERPCLEPQKLFFKFLEKADL
ncbi:glycosyltransferase family 9 protein [Thermodesulfobacterium sp.]|jgi:ADP-heptose:LPS heptosyltransferase|uniref:glycosyltransferase family 9 protein n=1 Tax=Thermodesulfobacterium sp. TaxID=1965289 RepID=UPI00257A2122|nr:glycosyltransferase family 9 protein [Thermodesulfobacterium sp.]MBZ4681755.1 glycoside hydrolase [Thermodesulfobacterium sp.]